MKTHKYPLPDNEIGDLSWLERKRQEISFKDYELPPIDNSKEFYPMLKMISSGILIHSQFDLYHMKKCSNCFCPHISLYDLDKESINIYGYLLIFKYIKLFGNTYKLTEEGMNFFNRINKEK